MTVFLKHSLILRCISDNSMCLFLIFVENYANKLQRLYSSDWHNEFWRMWKVVEDTVPAFLIYLQELRATMKTSDSTDINPWPTNDKTRATTTTMQHLVWKYGPDTIKIKSHHVISPVFQILWSLVFKNQEKWVGINCANISPIT
jgi:hypothetical protein